MPIGPDRVRHVVVIKLADACCEITLQTQVLRQTLLLGNRLAKDLTIVKNARGVRIQSRQNGVPAWTT